MSSTCLLKYADFDNFQNVEKMGILHILKQFFITYATMYKKTTDMNIISNRSSVGNNKKLDGEVLYLRSRS